MLPMDERYYLVKESILPEAVWKTARAKQLLAQGDARTVNEAVERVGLSRSAFYKYRDGVFPWERMETGRIVTISMDLVHRSGVLSKVLALVAGYDGNVLTIHQTIPLQGMANVVITVDTSTMEERLPECLEELKTLDGVKRAAVIGHG
jgi:chorismate mutase